MMREIRACSFTGHREIPAAHLAPLTELLDRAISYLYEKENVRTFYCGGALGFDTLAARRVILFRLSHPDARLVLLLPCADQSAAWSQKQSEAYEYTLRVADETVTLSEQYTADCMKKRNECLASYCDFLVAYVGRERSGAGQTMRIASRLGKTVYNLFGEASRAKSVAPGESGSPD